MQHVASTFWPLNMPHLLHCCDVCTQNISSSQPTLLMQSFPPWKSLEKISRAPETNGLPCRLQKWSHNSWICAINYLARQAVYFPAQHLLRYVFNITAQVDWWFKFSTQRSPPKGFSYAREPAMHNGSKQESQSHFNCAINCDFMISPWTYFYGREKCWEITRADGSRRMLRGSKWGNKFDLKGIHSRCAVPLNDFPLSCADREALMSSCSACCCLSWRFR